MERVSTGIAGMDKLLGGGLPRNRTFLLSGSCGTGKTIFASQFVYDGLKKGENCVYITLEQDKQKLLEDLKELGIDFAGMGKEGKLTLVGGPVGHMKYFMNKTRAGSPDIAREVKEIVEETKATRVVLDSVNLFTMLFDSDLERRKALAELASTLDQLDCTSLFTCEVREGTRDISWFGFEDFVVDGVMVLYRIPFENMFERAVSIVKMRGIEHAQAIRALKIGRGGMRVFPELEPFHKADMKKK